MREGQPASFKPSIHPMEAKHVDTDVKNAAFRKLKGKAENKVGLSGE